MNCGQKILDIPRPKNHKYKKHHKKALYCPWCKVTCNSIECRNDTEVYEFKENFLAGEYKEEALTSIQFIKDNDIWGDK
jgi:hypothetical protein